MGHSNSIRFVVKSEVDDDWPNPVRTHLWERPDELRTYIASLEPEQPLVIAPEVGDTIDIASYSDAIREAESAGRDVVIALPQA